jgi:hypothetical protein
MASTARPAAAIGCSDHTGWAVLVTLTGDAAAPRVLDRRRVTLVDEALPRMAYHAAASLPRTQAEALIAEVEASAVTESTAQLGALLADVGELGYEVTGVAIGDAPQVPDDLDLVLAKHHLLHAGEGALFREALVEAAAEHGLAITRFPHKDALGQAAAAHGVDPAALSSRLGELRRDLGAPWNADHRSAAAAALLTLTGSVDA